MTDTPTPLRVIAVPPGHDHLADALVRDCGFVKVHVDQPARDIALRLDPFVEAGVQLANMGRSPRLSSRLEAHKGDWHMAMARAPEIRRLLAVIREEFDPKLTVERDTVIVDVGLEDELPVGCKRVAIDGRAYVDGVDELLPAGDIVAEQNAVVGYARWRIHDAKAAEAVEELADSASK